MSVSQIGVTADGKKVFDRTEEPHLLTKPKEMIVHLPEIISAASSDNRRRFVTITEFPGCDFFSMIVDTSCSPQKDIYYAVFEGRRGHSRITKNRKPCKVHSLICIFSQISNDSYEPIAFFPGEFAYPEPWRKKSVQDFAGDSVELKEEIWQYWQEHAFVESYKPIDRSTIKKSCPWTPIKKH